MNESIFLPELYGCSIGDPRQNFDSVYCGPYLYPIQQSSEHLLTDSFSFETGMGDEGQAHDVIQCFVGEGIKPSMPYNFFGRFGDDVFGATTRCQLKNLIHDPRGMKLSGSGHENAGGLRHVALSLRSCSSVVGFGISDRYV